jgi:hypothetical protein
MMNTRAVLVYPSPDHPGIEYEMAIQKGLMSGLKATSLYGSIINKV